jgi:hypothetical protein
MGTSLNNIKVKLFIIWENVPTYWNRKTCYNISLDLRFSRRWLCVWLCYNAVYFGENSRFRRNMSPPSLWSKSEPCRLLLMVSCLAHFSTPKMEAVYSSEMSHCLRTTQRYNLDDGIRHQLLLFLIAHQKKVYLYLPLSSVMFGLAETGKFLGRTCA